MDHCVNSMLNFRTNLPQVVGRFDGHYTILVAHMNYVVASLPEQNPHQIVLSLIRSTFDVSNPNNKY